MLAIATHAADAAAMTDVRPLPDAEPLLAIRGLRFAWPGAAQPLLQIESLELAPGEALFLRGPSGCGKSTLLSLAAGVLVAAPGMVRLGGRDWAALSRSRRDAWRAEQVGYLFQQFNLLPYLSVLDNVLLPCRLSARRRERALAQPQLEQGSHAGLEPIACALLERMRLPRESWRRAAADLSVGQQQRVAAARALLGSPPLVIADEPTSALDETLREDFMALLLEACRRAGSALLFVSHDARLAGHFGRQADLPALNRVSAAGIAS